MTRVHLPSSADLDEEAQLGPFFLLELAGAVAANALRAHYIEIDVDDHLGELAEVTTARVLAKECDALRDTLNDHRRRILARLERCQRAWPF